MNTFIDGFLVVQGTQGVSTSTHCETHNKVASKADWLKNLKDISTNIGSLMASGTESAGKSALWAAKKMKEGKHWTPPVALGGLILGNRLLRKQEAGPQYYYPAQ